MGDLPTLCLANLIVDNYLNDDFNLVVIEGAPRIGKSAYAYKSMNEALDFLKGIKGRDVIERFWGWHPKQVSDRLLEIDKRIPCYNWDDAGVWLFALDFQDPLLKAIQRYFNLIGTDINTVLMTTPHVSYILKKIGNMPGMIKVRIIKTQDSHSDQPSKRFARRAIGYSKFTLPDDVKKRTIKKWIDDYSCKFPDDIYQYYLPIRSDYNRQAKLKIREEMMIKIQREEEKQRQLELQEEEIKIEKKRIEEKISKKRGRPKKTT